MLRTNSVAGTLGEGQFEVDGGGGIQNPYDWDQRQEGDLDLTRVVVSTTLGERVDLTASILGTFAGEQELTDSVVLDSDTVTGGTNLTDIETDWYVADLEVSVLLHRIASLHLAYRGYSYEAKGDLADDLGATGTPTTVATTWDWSRDSLSALFDVRPIRGLSVRVGAREVNRELDRDGFDGRPLRDTDFESDGDRTLIGGVTWRANSWFTLNADYEDLDVDQPFTAISPADASRARARLTFTPIEGRMRAVVGYADYENTNTAANFRDPDDLEDPGCDPADPNQIPGSCLWSASADFRRWDVSWTHQVMPGLDYLIRFAEQEVDTVTDVVVDDGPVPGTSIYDVDSTHALGQINYSWSEPWKVYLRYWIAESDGDNPFITAGFTDTPTARIMQDYSDAELGVRYRFASGIFVGGSWCAFDYDDENDLLDYDGDILAINVGTAF
jgi:hypothetical protein